MIYFGVEGYTLPSGYIAKELVIMQKNGEYQHHILLPPNGELSHEDYRTIRYVTRNLNGLAYHEGTVPYHTLATILDTIKQHTIYTYGGTAKRFLEAHLPSTVVIDIQEHGYQMPKVLPTSNCPKHHTPRYCALAKARVVLQYKETEHWSLKK